MSTNNNNTKYGIEKFEGSFDKEEGGCSIIVNNTVNSIKNMAAAGLYSYLICRPPGWKLNAKQLADHFECNKDTIYKALRILMDMGILTSTMVREKGRFTKTHYRVHLTPKNQAGIDSPPYPNSPDVDSSEVEITDTYKTKNIENKENKKTNKALPAELPSEDVSVSPDQKSMPASFNVSMMLEDNPHGITEELLEDWLVVRKSKRAVVTKTSWKRLNKQLTLIQEQAGVAPLEAFEAMVGASWQSVELKYFITKESSPRYSSQTQSAKAADNALAISYI